jgi:hypothetical protein
MLLVKLRDKTVKNKEKIMKFVEHSAEFIWSKEQNEDFIVVEILKCVTTITWYCVLSWWDKGSLWVMFVEHGLFNP